MGHGWLISPDGDFALPLRDGEHSSVQHRAECNGVLLPKHVQRGSLCLDAGGLPCADPRDCIRGGELLGTAVQHRLPPYCGRSSSEECERSSVLGGCGCLHLHDLPHPDANQVSWRTELLSPVSETKSSYVERSGKSLCMRLIDETEKCGM